MDESNYEFVDLPLFRFKWEFEQKKDLSGYEGSIAKGGEIFVTFKFCADREYHFLPFAAV